MKRAISVIADQRAGQWEREENKERSWEDLQAPRSSKVAKVMDKKMIEGVRGYKRFKIMVEYVRLYSADILGQISLG